MEYKKAKAYLDGIRSCRLNVLKLQASMDRVRHELDNPLTAVGYGSDKVQSTPKGDALERLVLRHIELLEKHERTYIEMKTELEKRIFEAEQLILKLPHGKPRDFLLRHYIDGVSEIDYAIEAGYESTSSVYKLRVRAVKLFAQRV